MSGYTMQMLLRAEDREDAISSAENHIENMFEGGDLQEGDRGYVMAVEAPENEDEEPTVIHASDDLPKFMEILKEIEQDRRREAQEDLNRAMKIITDAGMTPNDIRYDGKTDLHMFGYYLTTAGKLIGEHWCPWCQLVNMETWEYGWDPKWKTAEMIRENPEEWWLVETVVG